MKGPWCVSQRRLTGLFMIKTGEQRVLLEAGCGVGNLFYPLLEEIPNLFVHACDFSPRAVQFLKVSWTLTKTLLVKFTCNN